MAPGKTAKVFENCIFGIVSNSALPKQSALEHKKTLEEHGGTVLEIGVPIDTNVATHIISDTTDFPQFSEAQLAMIPVVTTYWIGASLMRSKEAPIRPYTPDPRMIFNQITITCADIPQGDKDAIIGAVLAMGGTESNALTKVVTHICALTLDHPKCQMAMERKYNCKIVLPHWFDDCLKLGKKIDEGPYLLPNPEILQKGAKEAVPFPASTHIDGHTSPQPDIKDLHIPRTITVFSNKKIMLSDDLQLGERTRNVLEHVLEKGGGTMTTSVHDADMYICQYRLGRDYVFASRANKDVGNLSWLFHMIARDEWTSPMRRLLHYPLPKKPLEGFEGFVITLSNYAGDARVYLEHLITATGAQFTKSMKEENTHLITARKASEKCEAAAVWGIEMVNHLWIEESYARCKVQPLSDPRYTHFPPRTNLGEIIGQTQMDSNILQKLYFPRDPTPQPGDPQLPRRAIMHEKDRNENTSRSKNSTSDIAMGGQDDADADSEEQERAVETKKLARKPKVKSTGAAQASVATPVPNRRLSVGKENDTPSTSSRSAKSKAASRIHGLADDIALYEKEKKRKGPIWGGERAIKRIDKERTTERSSSPAANNEEEMSVEENTDVPVPKRRKVSGIPSVPIPEIRLLITGYHGWLSNAAKEDRDKKKLRQMGVLVVQDPLTCTHVAAPKIVRTMKFLCALSVGPTFVNSEFIDTCIEKGEIPDEKAFLLKDKENEKKFGVKLPDVVNRAKANKRMLLRGVIVYATEKLPNRDTYKQILEANGATFGLYRGRRTIKKVSPEEDDGPAEPIYLLTGATPEERKLWPKFREMAKDGNMIPRVIGSDWLLEVCLTQQNRWNDDFLVDT